MQYQSSRGIGVGATNNRRTNALSSSSSSSSTSARQRGQEQHPDEARRRNRNGTKRRAYVAKKNGSENAVNQMEVGGGSNIGGDDFYYDEDRVTARQEVRDIIERVRQKQSNELTGLVQAHIDLSRGSEPVAEQMGRRHLANESGDLQAPSMLSPLAQRQHSSLYGSDGRVRQGTSPRRRHIFETPDNADMDSNTILAQPSEQLIDGAVERRGVESVGNDNSYAAAPTAALTDEALLEDEQLRLLAHERQLQEQMAAVSRQRVALRARKAAAAARAAAEAELAARQGQLDAEVAHGLATLNARKANEAKAITALKEDLAAKIAELCRLYEQARRQEQSLERRMSDAADALRADAQQKGAALWMAAEKALTEKVDAAVRAVELVQGELPRDVPHGDEPSTQHAQIRRPTMNLDDAATDQLSKRKQEDKDSKAAIEVF
jgi:hypothetical protein